MKPFERILFPVDFSDHCAQAACWVGDVARSLGSELYLLHVYEGYDSGELGVGSQANEGDIIQHLVDLRQGRLKNFCVNSFEGVPVHRIVKWGTPAASIISFAKKHDIQLIIMPTRGEGRFHRMLAGSVTLKVLHEAGCPVWTTAHAETLRSGPTLQIKSILCAIDMGPESELLVGTAAKLAHLWGAAVHVVYDIPDEKKETHEDCTKRLNQFIERVKNQVRDAGGDGAVSFDTYVAAGPIAQKLQNLAVQLNADLVMVGHGRIRQHFGEFRSHLAAIIHDSPCPVLSV